ncbi:hypothetical protein FEM48_Zijuj12G0125800 [Ziziphus jujuba var. spinosa]|uniref:60S ribosomal protein L18a-like protein n=1 Tax=Ziziphus jujuba var. spinosa TaxID=714518 RepID=A0A978UDD0_ZIZJJ|nr:hypothetical protein FEM48_Zijuj12G0125800 [Ziziphus jujuba var. spinosa]
MSVEENKKGVVVDHQHHHQHHQSEPQPQPPPQYGTFQGVANYPPPLPPRPPQQPAIGFPRPVPPPGATASGGPPPDPHYYAHGYQTVPGMLHLSFSSPNWLGKILLDIITVTYNALLMRIYCFFVVLVGMEWWGDQTFHHEDREGVGIGPCSNTKMSYAVAEGRPVRERRLPCCGLGFGWFLFIIGFFLAAIPWYIGAIILLCARVDHREKPGYIGCVVAVILAVRRKWETSLENDLSSSITLYNHVHGCNCNGDKAEMLQWLILGRISFVIWLMMIMRLAILATVAIVFGVVKGVDD